MMNKLEEAIIYATLLHQGKARKIKNTPYILHPLEVAEIISTMTDDIDIITAGVLHDVVEDTDGTLPEIRNRFGERVAELVSSETENKYPGQDSSVTWMKRKEDSLHFLKNSTDTGVKMLWLADKLSNIRALAGSVSELGDDVWEVFNQKDPAMHCWYYRKVAEYVELELNRTGAYKELIKHINYIWPGTIDVEKSRYKKYKEVSVEGCKLIGRGAKGDVYRYDDELIIKVYNEKNTYADVEREIELSRKAFVMGLPTAISFGIVAVGKQYGAMYELLDSPSVSNCIASAPVRVGEYARLMADIGHMVHSTETDEDVFPDSADTMRLWITEGVMRDDEMLANRIIGLINALPPTKNIVHGDFHTGNVLLQNGEPLLIDLDRMSVGNPIFDLAGLYMSYIFYASRDPEQTKEFMGFTAEVAGQFYNEFIKAYLETEDEKRISAVNDKVALISAARIIRQVRKKRTLSEEQEAYKNMLIGKIRELVERVDSIMI
ncbi:MAG: HD domain-containing protein [Lachnospiraceae bacterium]|nr:HD domain-containing protein [Lachnospiraceae bacterium]